MTRDEAIRIMMDAVDPDGEQERATRKDSEMMVDLFAKLGMLRLSDDHGCYPDGSPVPQGKIGKVIWFMGLVGLSHMSPGKLESALARTGLKIVEA